MRVGEAGVGRGGVLLRRDWGCRRTIRARRSLEEGITELIRAYRLLPHGAFRNA